MKLIKMSLIAIVATCSTYAADEATIDGTVPDHGLIDTIHDGHKDNGEIYGQFRTFYLDRTYLGGIVNNRNTLSAGGYVGYMTPVYNGFSAMVAAYGTYGFKIHGDPVTSANYDPSMYGAGFENYAFIGHAYVNYESGETNVKAGRMRLDTPFAGADDARMLPNLFEAALVTNKSLENTTLIAGHVFRETIGTFGNVYGTGWKEIGNTGTYAANSLALQSGYGLGLGLDSTTSGSFENMGVVALGNQDANGNYVDNSTSGVSVVAGVYEGIEGLKLQAWDYIAWDIVNTLYLQGDYSFKVADGFTLVASAQYINQRDIGGAYLGNVNGGNGKINSNYIAGKITGKYDNFTAYFAYSSTGSNNDTFTNGGIITPWGGMPAFTQGMVTRHQFFANTDTIKIAATYNFKAFGLKASAYYTEFDMGSENTYRPGIAWKSNEPGFDFQYKIAAVDGLNFRFRGNFPNAFGASAGSEFDWDEYRVILNYNF